MKNPIQDSFYYWKKNDNDIIINERPSIILVNSFLGLYVLGFLLILFLQKIGHNPLIKNGLLIFVATIFLSLFFFRKRIRINRNQILIQRGFFTKTIPLSEVDSFITHTTPLPGRFATNIHKIMAKLKNGKTKTIVWTKTIDDVVCLQDLFDHLNSYKENQEAHKV